MPQEGCATFSLYSDADLYGACDWSELCCIAFQLYIVMRTCIVLVTRLNHAVSPSGYIVMQTCTMPVTGLNQKVIIVKSYAPNWLYRHPAV